MRADRSHPIGGNAMNFFEVADTGGIPPGTMQHIKPDGKEVCIKHAM
jgi:hypothetical protein